MALHARQVAVSAGASPELAGAVANQLVKEGNINIQRAIEIIHEWRQA